MQGTRSSYLKPLLPLTAAALLSITLLLAGCMTGAPVGDQASSGTTRTTHFPGTPDFTALIEEARAAAVNIKDSGTSLGTGFIVHPAGYILTARHVVDSVENLNVALSSGLVLEARLIASDDASDLALLKVTSTEPLQVLDVRTAPPVRLGEWIVVIGNPFGLGLTASAGIVGAHGVALGTANPAGWIQTDASINPGNSGGPVLNTRGEVVGIASALISVGQGVGFLTPIESARRLLDQALPRN